MRNVTIVGAGRLGGALALALDRAGFIIDVIVDRGTRPSPQLIGLLHSSPLLFRHSDPFAISSEIILITTQDSEIGSVAEQLASKISGRPSVFITSGALSSSVLLNLKDLGCPVGSIHPLVSISDPLLGPTRFAGAYFCLEGDKEALDAGESMVHALQGRSFNVPTDKKPLYHAAAVTSSGHIVALIDLAVQMLEKCGLDQREAKKVLLPLIESTIENAKEQSLEQSLTGTFARGDSETFALHLQALQENVSRDEIEIFLALASRSIEIARRLRSENRSLDDLQERVLIAKRALR